MKGRHEEANAIIAKHGRKKEKAPEDSRALESLVKDNAPAQNYVTEFNYSILDVLKNPMLLCRIIVFCVLWSQFVLVFYGFTFNLNQFDQSLYVTMLLGAVQDVITCLLPFLIVGKPNRRRMPTWVIGMVVILICSFISWFVPSAGLWASLIGRGMNNFCGVFLYLVVTELFPTSVRAACYAIPVFAGKIVGIAAPYYGALQHENVALFFPLHISFVVLVIIVLIVFVPETGKLPIPDSIEEAEVQSDYTLLKSIKRCLK